MAEKVPKFFVLYANFNNAKGIYGRFRGYMLLWGSETLCDRTSKNVCRYGRGLSFEDIRGLVPKFWKCNTRNVCISRIFLFRSLCLLCLNQLSDAYLPVVPYCSRRGYNSPCYLKPRAIYFISDLNQAQYPPGRQRKERINFVGG